MTESGIAGSAIVEHPDNRMITTVLQRTAHLRPTDGFHDPSGLSIAPLSAPQQTPLPLGLVPATPAVTTPTKQQDKKARGHDFKSRITSFIKKPSVEETSKDLDQRERILLAKINTGLPSSPLAEVSAELELNEIANDRRRLKERAGLEDAGGKTADWLAQRLKKKAEEDGMNQNLLPL